MEYMPEELLHEIMLKLPMKAVARWKCVCKSWYSFLNSPDFITQYLQLSNNKIRHHNDHHDLILKFYGNDDLIETISIISHETLGVVDTQKLSTYTQKSVKKYFDKIVGCRNGVVCITAGYDDEQKVLLWNPKTRHVKVVLCSSYCRGPSSSKPHYCDRLVGFGFDDKNDDYKVVSIEGHPSSNHSEGVYYDVEVYSLKLDRWRLVRCSFKDRFLEVNTLIHDTTTCTDGMCSWPVRHRGSDAVLSFDMSKEIMILTPLPSPNKRYSKECRIKRKSQEERQYRVDLVDLNGHVAFFDHLYANCYNIWWLGEIGVKDSWTKLFSIHEFQCNERPLGFWKNFGLVLQSDDDGELVLLDLATLQKKRILQICTPPFYSKIFN